MHMEKVENKQYEIYKYMLKMGMVCDIYLDATQMLRTCLS